MAQKAASSGSRSDQVTPTVGVPSTVTWDPHNHVVKEEKRPPFIGLGHEFVHAYRGVKGTAVYRIQATELFGTQDPRKQQELRTKREENIRRDEFEVVGIEDTPGTGTEIVPTENVLRAEHGLPPRTSYGDF